MAAKEILSRIRLVVNAGSAKPAPPVGPALGQAGLNIMVFCKEFNAKTSEFQNDVPFRVSLTAFKDKTFEWVSSHHSVVYINSFLCDGKTDCYLSDVRLNFVIFRKTLKSPPTSYFIKKAAGLPRGSSNPGHQMVSGITLQHIHEIAKVKASDSGMEHVKLESICSSIMGTARSMGIPVVDLPGSEEIKYENRVDSGKTKYDGLPQWIQDFYRRRKK